MKKIGFICGECGTSLVTDDDVVAPDKCCICGADAWRRLKRADLEREIERLEALLADL
jgi:rubrerythrin